MTAGIQQLLLTGNTSLYPSPGLAVGGAYNFRWMNLNWNAQAEYGMYSASNKDVSAMLIEFGVLLNP